MQEVYYVYKTRETGDFKLVADRGRLLSDIEVDVSIAHQENAPLGSIKWHKVIVNPADTPERLDQNLNWKSMAAARSLNHEQDNRGLTRKASKPGPARVFGCKSVIKTSEQCYEILHLARAGLR